MRRSVSRIRPAQLAQGVLEVLALALELLDVRERLLVLVLRERVDRAELLAAALQALDPALQVRALGLGQRLGGRLGLEAQALGEAAELRAGVAGGVARLLGADLAAGDGLAALLQARVDLRLAGGARAQLAGQLLARRAVGLQLGAERLGLGGDRAARLPRARPRAAPRRGAAPRRARGAPRRARSGARARPARAPPARRAASRWRSRPAAARGARRRGPRRAVLRRWSISQRAWRSASAASSRARAAARAARSASSRPLSASATARVAASTRASAACSACAAFSTSATSPSRRLRSASTRSSPPAGTWRSSRVAADQTRPPRVTAIAGEAVREPVDGVDDPHVGEQPLGEPPRRRRRPRA